MFQILYQGILKLVKQQRHYRKVQTKRGRRMVLVNPNNRGHAYARISNIHKDLLGLGKSYWGLKEDLQEAKGFIEKQKIINAMQDIKREVREKNDKISFIEEEII